MTRSDIRRLIEWYENSKRDLPWRATRDPYLIWVSEIMLQQTRVAAVIPYYRRFTQRFPDIATLAAASGEEVLAMWSGLGYYSRVRNMQRAAREMGDAFPATYGAIRQLPGVGDYTAAAVASIAFGQPHAAIDGNVLRVLARLTGEKGDVSSTATRGRLREVASAAIPPDQPGTFNQAMMELGATVCVPRGEPLCGACPLAECCVARREGRQQEIPIKTRPTRSIVVERTLVYAARLGRVLLTRYPSDAPKLAGFWELPDLTAVSTRSEARLGSVRHSITNTDYVVHVVAAELREAAPTGCEWRDLASTSPLSTLTRKALALARVSPSEDRLAID